MALNGFRFYVPILDFFYPFLSSMSASSGLFVNFSDGNVGIGTTTPAQKMVVEGGLITRGNIIHGNFIAFHIVRLGVQLEYRGTGAVTFLDTALHNVGSCFNITTGLFTPTVRGYYAFSASLGCNNGRAFQLRLNASNASTGTKYAATYTAANPGSTTLSAVVYMNGSTDYVGLYPSSSSVTDIGVVINTDSFFCGYLLTAA